MAFTICTTFAAGRACMAPSMMPFHTAVSCTIGGKQVTDLKYELQRVQTDDTDLHLRRIGTGTLGAW